MSSGMQQSRPSKLAALRSAGAVVSVSVEQLKSDLLCAGSRRAAASKPFGSPVDSPCSLGPTASPPSSVDGSEISFAVSMSRTELLGCWVDSIGNFVLVRSVEAPDEELTATLVKPWAENISLDLWQTEDGGDWRCGSAVLDLSRSSSRRLVWVFPEGRQLVWTWRAFTLEALEARGLNCVKGMACTEAEYRASPPSTPGSEDSSQQWVAVCVPVGDSPLEF